MQRRQFASSLLAGAAAASVSAAQANAQTGAKPEEMKPLAKRGRLRQGVCMGVFRNSGLEFDAICKLCADLGIVGIDLVGPDRFETMKKYGLIPTMLPGSSKLDNGINDKTLHAEIITNTKKVIDDAAAAGAPNAIMLSGNRRGKSDEEGLENSALLLNAVKKYAEDKNVTLCLELLNSKVNHPDYQCDRTKWGVELMKRVASPKVKLLYDIYHMQIMEGDIIRTIKDNYQYFGHFHTAGNPGRHELSPDQEIYYPPICKTIADMGYQGVISHEYTPTVLPAAAALMQAIQACTV